MSTFEDIKALDANRRVSIFSLLTHPTQCPQAGIQNARWLKVRQNLQELVCVVLTFLPTAEAILCATGMPHELETRLVDGQLLRVYKNIWPSLRAFWLWVSNEHKDRTYIIFEQQRWTYAQILERALKVACIFRDTYGIQKGDRVGICSRNFPDYLVAFWACHLLGAVSVLANAYADLAL